MNLNRTHRIVLGAVALIAAGGGGAAIAASQTGSPSAESQAIIDDAAGQLGISPSKLSGALKKALSDRVDEAVASGRLSKAEGDELKQRIQSEDFPLFGGLHHGLGARMGFFHDLDAAADYLGIGEADLRAQLRDGKTLAQVARDRGKSVAGLVDALVADAKEHLDRAVSEGRITQAQEDRALSELKERIQQRVDENLPLLPRFRPFEGFGLRHHGRSA